MSLRLDARRGKTAGKSLRGKTLDGREVAERKDA
jgi:hypothetical protein